MHTYQNISLRDAEELLDSTNMLVFDMRDYKSFVTGHHPKAIHLNNDNLRTFLKELSRDIPILIYCYHGHSSQDMAQLFCDFGFEHCYSLEGGYEAWFQNIKLPQFDLTPALIEWMKTHNFDPMNLDKREANNNTALMVAAREADYDKCRELIAAGASLNLTNKDGNNALWMCCYSEAEDVFDLLLAQGIDINNQNDNGATALIYAASAGKTNMVKKLLGAGADAALVTMDDFSALDVASNLKILRLLRRFSPRAESNEMLLSI